MIVLGLVLLLLAVALGVVVVLSNPAALTLSLFSAQVPVTLGGVFLTGAGALLVAVVGLLLIQRGIARGRRKRRERKRLPPPVVETTSPVRDDAQSTRPVTTKPVTPASAPSPAATPARSTVTPAGPRGNAEDSGGSTSSERAALLEEADQLTRDDKNR